MGGLPKEKSMITPARKQQQAYAKREEIKMEENIPLPPVPKSHTSGSVLYPVADLKEGGSFSYPMISGQTEKQLTSVKTAFRHHQKTHPEKNFVALAIPGESVIRVWRTADTKAPEQE